ncbi:DUF6134 family protein [Larkinella bovis]|uniref:DUF6134 family protein n=1 Tax=Larkinella bovis TaxID=683041 RepID=A0ABW0IAV2_9BACT
MIEASGLRIGKLQIAQITTPTSLVYDQVSNVEFKLIKNVRIYYKTVSRHDPATGQLLRSETDATTSRGNFRSEISWLNSQYEITVNQYKYARKAVEAKPIDFTISRMYFEEPAGRSRAFAEYFGNYATIELTKKGSYRVRIDDHEDAYFYEKGKLVKILKKNALKNYTIRFIE